MKSVFFNANEHWALIDSEQEFEKTAKYGTTISLGFAFVVLLFATKNLIISLFVVLSIAIVIVSVLFVIFMQNWRLGLSESICLVVILALSIDYTSHLANEYI
jgi:predicted RND superfamily exporter protein